MHKYISQFGIFVVSLSVRNYLKDNWAKMFMENVNENFT